MRTVLTDKLFLFYVFECVFCVFTKANLFGQFVVFSVFPLRCCLVVSISAIDCLERLVSDMTCYVSSGTLNPRHTHSLTKAHNSNNVVMYSQVGHLHCCLLISVQQSLASPHRCFSPVTNHHEYIK